MHMYMYLVVTRRTTMPTPPPRASGASKYGKYLPHQRFNVDQVPLPFVNGMDETYEEVGAKRVAINQNGATMNTMSLVSQ